MFREATPDGHVRQQTAPPDRGCEGHPSGEHRAGRKKGHASGSFSAGNWPKGTHRWTAKSIVQAADAPSLTKNSVTPSSPVIEPNTFEAAPVTGSTREADCKSDLYISSRSRQRQSGQQRSVTVHSQQRAG